MDNLTARRCLDRLAKCVNQPKDHEERLRGDWIGILFGLRPGRIVENSETADKPGIIQILSDVGIHAFFQKGMLIVERAVLERVRLEPQLASFVRWRSDLTVEENSRDAWQYLPTEGARSDLLTGFLLGFPASAISGYEKGRVLRARGIPWLDAAKPGSDWPSEDRKLLEDMQFELNRTGPDIEYSNAQWREAYLHPGVRSLLRRHYGATEADLDFIASQVIVEIETAQGDIVFTFVTFEGGEVAEDVVRLGRKVRNLGDI